MGKLKSREPLPFHVRRVISGYKPYLREIISQALQSKIEELHAVGRNITRNEIDECVGYAVGELATGSRNLQMERLSWEAYQRGDCKPLKEVIDELRASIAESTST
jgi:hypothetical protein